MDFSKYNVSDATSRAVNITIPTSLVNGSVHEYETRREPFETNQPNSRAFVLRKILSDDECESLIQETEKIGYDTADDIKFEYPETYRNNQRMIVINPVLAKSLWSRLQRFLTTDDVFDVAPVGFLADVCLNDGFIISKYSPGQFFKPHQDGLYINKNEEYSIFSVVFYLNELCGNKGGHLNFLNEKNEVCSQFIPEKGSAIVFNSDALHEGALLKEGHKYMLRTFIMFRCVKSFSESEKLTISADPRWQDIIAIFMEIEKSAKNIGNLSKEDIVKFTNDYLCAQRIQYSKSHTIRNSNLMLPLEIYRAVFRRLDPDEVLNAMLVSREWYRVGRDNELWRYFYYNCTLSTTPPSLSEFNYFGLFRSEFVDSTRSVMVLANKVTYLGDDTPLSRFAGTVVRYNKWDQSMMELVLDFERCSRPSQLQNWYNTKEERLEGFDYYMKKGVKEDLWKRSYNYNKPVSALSYLAHLVLKNQSERKNLLLVYFPLHFTIFPSKMTEFTGKRTVHPNPRSKDAMIYGDIYRIPSLHLSFLLDYALLLNFQTHSTPYYDAHEDEVIKFGLMEVTVAACCAFDLRSAIVVLYHKLVSHDTLQVVSIENLVIKCDKFYSIHLKMEEICRYIDEKLVQFSKNLIFISDMDGDLSIEENALTELKKYGKLKKSMLVEGGSLADHILKNISNRSKANVWYAKDLDIYYGAKKYRSDIPLYPYNLKSSELYYA